MGFKKGQAALDFLMTYGWAIALVVIIAAVLFALGVFDVGTFVGNKAAGFSQMAVTGWNLPATGLMTLKVSNQAGVRVNITSINVTIADKSSMMDLSGMNPLNAGESSGTLTAAQSLGTFTSGTSYTAKVKIDYRDLNAGFDYTTSGTLTGKVA